MPDRSKRIGVIGAGRLGSTLAIALDAAGYEIDAIQRRNMTHLRGLSRWLPGARRLSEPQDVADRCDVVFITTPDQAIFEVARRVSWRGDQWVLHPSGATSLDALGPASASGAGVGSLHPLQTFPVDYGWAGPASTEAGETEERQSATHPRDRFFGVAMAIEADRGELQTWLQRLASDLGGHPIQLRPEDRAAYHASAVMACGLTAALIGLAADIWSAFGVGREEALNSLDPLVRATVDAVLRDGLPAALTGPFVRGDVETVAQHLAALGKQGADLRRAYAALALAALPMAAEQGHLSPENRLRLQRTLEDALGDNH